MESDQCWALLNYSFLQESRYQNICFMLLIIDSVKRGWQKLISMPTAKQLVLPRTVWNNASHIAPCQKLQYVAMFCFESEFCWQISPTSLRHLVIFLTSLLHKLQYSQPGSQYKRLSTPHSTSDHLMPTYFHCSCGEIFRLLTFWFLVALLIFCTKKGK